MAVGVADPEAEGSCLSDAIVDILTESGSHEILYRSEVFFLPRTLSQKQQPQFGEDLV